MTDKNTKLDQQAEVVEADSEQVEASKPSRTLWSDAWNRLRKNKLALIGAAHDAVLARYGIDLTCEVKLLGFGR